MRMLRVTAITGIDNVLAALNNLGADRVVGATKETATRHPDGNADGEKQSQRFVREQIHSLRVYSRANIFVEA